MKIASLYTRNAVPEESNNGGGNGRAVSKSDGAFDSFLQRVDQKSQKAVDRSVEAKKPDEIKKRRNVNENKPRNDNDSAVKTPEEESVTSEVKAAQVSGEQTDSKPVDEKNADLQEKIVAELAEVLEISPEVLSQMLSSLGLQASDLYDKANLNKFIQMVYQVDSQVELLSIPDITDVFEDINAGLAALEESELTNLVHSNTVEAKNIPADTKMTDNTIPVIQTNMPKVDEQSGVEADVDLLESDKPVENTVKTSAEQQNQANDSNERTGGELLGGDDQAMSYHYDESVAGIGVAANSNTAFQEVTARTESVKNINTSDVVNQLVENLKVEIKGNTSEVRMVLHPEALGEVSLKIATQNGIVTAQFIAENQRVKEIIEANFEQLRDVLQQQGVEVAGLSVSVGNGSADEAMARFNQERQRSAAGIRRIMDADGTTELEDEINYVERNDVYNNKVEYTV